jgi:hypothetical protein
MKRGRKTALNIVALGTTNSRAKAAPPSILSDSEQRIFAETVAGFPHLDQCDALLVAAFAQASVKAQELAKSAAVPDWERAVRTQLALARSLRLTQQSRVDPQSLGRRMADKPKERPPWLRGREE